MLRFAVVSDTHFWQSTTARSSFISASDARAVRDGLLVSESDSVLPLLLSQLAAFARSGGDFAIHAGDAVCGGASFKQPAAEFVRSLASYRQTERRYLGDWPVFHIPGNHDMHPVEGGTAAWRAAFCSPNATGSGPCKAQDGRVPPSYRALHAHGWRLLLLDATDGLSADVDGHGHIGRAQLEWLQAELDESAAAKEQVILVVHQLLAMPNPQPAWLDVREDFVDNRGEVLSLLSNYDHVRLSLHGHVHANSLTTAHGIPFVSTAAAAEFPMQWREVAIFACEIHLSTRSIDPPTAVVEKSRRRDTRAGRNEIKIGPAIANSIIISTCDWKNR